MRYLAEDPVKYYLAMVVAMFFWGGSWVSAKILVAISPPLTIGFFRFLVAGILFALLLPATGMKPWKLVNRNNAKILFLAGLTGVFGYGVLFLTGMRFTTAAQGSIIAGFNPASVSLFAHIIHGERLRRKWQYSGFALAFTGVVFVVGVQALIAFQLDHLVGNLIIVGAMLMWGLYSSIGKEAMKTMSAAEVTAGGVGFGCVLFGLGALTEEVWALSALYDPVFWINVLYLGAFVTFVAFLFYFAAIKNIGATRTGGFINLVPVFGTALSVLILNEQIYWTFILGIALVIIGIITINLPDRNDKKIVNSVEGSEDR